MKYIEIYRLQKDRTQKVVLTCKLVGENEIIFEGEDQRMAKELGRKGIKEMLTQKVLMPSEGIKFLEGIKFHFKSGYLATSDILETKENRIK